MVDELDPLRNWEADYIPNAATVDFARRRLEEAMAGKHTQNPKQAAIRPVLLGAALLLVAAGSAVALRWSPEQALQVEGRRSVPGSVVVERELGGDVTWTAYSYETDDGLRCLDVVVSDEEEIFGTVGGCDTASESGEFPTIIGGIAVGSRYMQILYGPSSDSVVLVRATSDDGQQYEDHPQSGVWIITPTSSSASWSVDALDASGSVVRSVVLTDADA